VSIAAPPTANRSRTPFVPPKNSITKKLKPYPQFLIFEAGPVGTNRYETPDARWLRREASTSPTLQAARTGAATLQLQLTVLHLLISSPGVRPTNFVC